MKKTLGKIPAPTLVLSVLSVMFIILGFIYSKGANYSDTITEAVNITDGIMDPSLEGQFVCVSGKPELKKAPVDPLTGVKADCFALVRTVEMYQYYIGSDDEVYKKYIPYQQENIKGKHGEEHINPEFPSDLLSSVTAGEVYIGDYQIGEEFLAAVNSDYTYFTKDYDEYCPVNLPAFKNSYGFRSTEDGYYTNEKDGNAELGDLRISYSYLRASDIGEMTVFGILRDGKIIQSEDMCGVMTDKITDPEEMTALIKGDSIDNPLGMWFTATVLMIIAAVIFIVRRKNERKGTV